MSLAPLRILAFAALAFVGRAHAADEKLTLATASAIRKAASDGNLTGINPLTQFADRGAAEFALTLIGEKRVPVAAQQRITEAVRAWPAVSEGKKALLDFLNKHRDCDDGKLRILAGIGMPDAEPVFAEIIEKSLAGKLPKQSNPARLAIAVGAYGFDLLASLGF